MTYSIIGTGNIAWFLGKRLTIAGHECAGVYGRNTAAADTLAEALRANSFQTITDVSEAQVDVCFMAVSDNSIAGIAEHLHFTDTVLIHTAGAMPIDVLAGAAQNYGVLWPVYSIQKSQLPSHRQIPCAWEANSSKAKRLVLAMAHAVTDELFEADMEQRKWMHVSAVIGNNFINHLVAICGQLCDEHNIPFTALQPILKQTFGNMGHIPAYDAQTGPARRGDRMTIEKQISLLEPYPYLQPVYEAISASIMHLYKSNAKEKEVNP